MKIFNTLADLKAAKLSAGQVVETKGEISVGDGLGARYLIGTDAADEVDVFALANSNTATLLRDTQLDFRTGKGVFATVADMIAGTPSVGSITAATWAYMAANSIRVKTLAYNTAIEQTWIIVPNATGTDDGGSYIDLDSGYQAKQIFGYGTIFIKQFGAACDGTTNDQTAFQNAINYAYTKLTTVSGKDDRGGVEVIFENITRVTQLRIARSNIILSGLGNATLLSTETYVSAPVPLLIVGTAETWQTGGSISSTTKYNKLRNFRISRDSGSNRIGILSSGTRNMSIENVNVESNAVGLWMENTSELSTINFSSTGSIYSIVGDNRKNRSAANSPLGVACTDNDVSACTFTQTTSYYSQHTGILLLNTGTMNFNGTTVGIFSDNPTAGSPFYGLPSKYAGVHISGGDTSFTRGGKIDGIVFEANQSETHDCILLESNSKNNPIRGVTINNAHVQVYATDYTTPNLTTLIVTDVNGTGALDGCKVSNSGFRFQDTGYYYPPLVRNDGDVVDVGIVYDNCYPFGAFSTSDILNGVLNNTKTIQAVDFEATEADTVTPLGWVKQGSLTGVGGSDGVQRSIQFTGDTVQCSIDKTFTIRNYKHELGHFFISFWYKGNVAPLVFTRINSQSDTDRTAKSGTNQSRYGTALQDPPQSTTWRRCTLAFKDFSASTPFDHVRIILGRPAGLIGDLVEIKGLEIGYSTPFTSKYNIFE